MEVNFLMSQFKNFQIQNFATTFFNQTPYYLDDLLGNINHIEIKHDRKYYKNILENYFKSKNLDNKNFQENFIKNFNSLI